jgi:hypothetical protein
VFAIYIPYAVVGPIVWFQRVVGGKFFGVLEETRYPSRRP